MPRKKNSGFGTPKSFSFKSVKPTNTKLDKSLPVKAAGVYPSNRQFGSSVQRTVIERYDAESDWIRWRKGYEYYCKAAFENLITWNPVTEEYEEAELTTQLYPGEVYELDVTFYGWRFSTKDSDSNNHYVMKRTAKLYSGEDPELFYVTEGGIDSITAKANNEYWVEGTLGADSKLLLRSLGERLTDGKTEATMTYVLNEEKLPGVYTGKSDPDKLTSISVLLRTSELENNEWLQERGGDIKALIGEIGLLPRMQTYKNSRDVSSLEFIDESYFFTVDITDTISRSNNFNQEEYFRILDNESSNLPPSLYDLTVLEPIFITRNYEGTASGSYNFQKSDYQKFYGQSYMTAQTVEDQISTVSYNTLPFIIREVSYKYGGFNVELIAEPFMSELQLFSLPDVGEKGYLIFADYSFTETMLDTVDGEYAHRVRGPYNNVYEQIAADNEFSKQVWYKKVNNVDPYIGYLSDLGTLKNPFNNPSAPLRLAEIYSCSCPNYSQAQLRMPQTTMGPGERKVNRQRNYPLPTALSRKDYEGQGTLSAAGVVQIWQNDRAAASFKLCKHMIACMFDEYLKLQEPNTYQTIDAREQFGRKLASDIADAKLEFKQAYARGGINTLEIIFALAQGLGYSDTEIADLVLNAKF